VTGAFLRLDADRVVSTTDLLCRRVEQRFPESGLARVGRELLDAASRARERAAWIARPILGLRVAASALILLIVAGLVTTFMSLATPREPLTWVSFVQALESGLNDLVLIAAGIFFLATVETRIKRHRALAAINELRAIAHIIDMHQLTKDPEWVLPRGRETGIAPRRQLSAFELSRYLDYCSEMLALTAKVAAIYIQDFDDGVALSAVNEVEDLTTGLSRKVWQKLMILYALQPGGGPRDTG
jgi:hypothetical protein